MLVLRLQLKKQLFHGDGGKDLKLFPVGLSRVLCPKTQGLFDPQRTPGSQLSHLCLTSTGREDTGLKVKFRLCHFSAVQETRTWPHKHLLLLRAVQTPLTHKEDRERAGVSPTSPTSPSHEEQIQTGSGKTLQANLHLKSHTAASWSFQNLWVFQKKGLQQQSANPQATQLCFFNAALNRGIVWVGRDLTAHLIPPLP